MKGGFDWFMEKEIIILTKSAKYGGLCVAGVDFKTGEWIRLVKKGGGQITNNIMRYRDGSYVKILDCIAVHTLGSAATPIQPENVYIDIKEGFVKVKKISIGELLMIHNLENHKNILGNYSHVIRHNVENVGHSLELIKVQNAILHRVMGSNGYYKSKLDFYYNNVHYMNMSITDPDYFNVEDVTRLGELIIVLSIPDDDYSKNYGYFKFVAKIFRLN